MLKDKLFEKLNYLKAYRKNRLEAAQWVLDNPNSLSELLTFCSETEDEISYKAAWVLEFVCKEKIGLLLPHLDTFFEILPKTTKDQAIRPMAKICEMMVLQYYKKQNLAVLNFLNENHKKTMTECCFDWLITNQKVACQAHAMTCLYYLGTEAEWIQPELKNILKENISQHSAGYQARAKNILKKMG